MQEKIPTQTEKILPALYQFKSDMQRLYQNKLSSLILFGSYARGTATELSDIDLLLVLNQMASPYKEIAATSDITTRYFLDYGLNISLVPTTTQRYNEMDLSFYRNVKKEGIALWKP